MKDEPVSRTQYLVRTATVFALYFTAGRLGLSAPFTSGNVSPVWPASGLALALVILWGHRTWPGLAAAAFFVNFLSPLPAVTCAAMATGNTLSALVGAFLIRRFVGGQLSLQKMQHVIVLLVLGAAVPPIVAASIGSTALLVTHIPAWSGFTSAWRIWWLGDAMGVLIVTPLFFAGWRALRIANLARAIELIVLIFGLLATCIAIFGGRLGLRVQDDVLAFLAFPFVIWAAIRFRTVGAPFTTFLIASIAVWGTAYGYGPFAKHTPLHDAILLQLFIAVTAITGLILGAVISEREEIGEAFESKQQLLEALEQAQTSLQDAHAQLENRVRERTAELERRTEQVLEQATLLDLANDAIMVRDSDGEISYWNRGAERLYGWSREDVIGKAVHDVLKTDFPQPFAEIREQLLRAGYWQGELRHSKRDGSRITVASRWSLWSNRRGKDCFLELNTDISAFRRAEESLRALSGRLLTLQDEERRRIARELHDSAGQITVALDINLASILAESNALSPKAANAGREARELVRQLSNELRTISHLLHPPLLDEAGLQSAVSWFVDGFSERSKIAVSLDLTPDLGRFSPEVETAIFRIVQECLTNIHRHSGSQAAAIRIAQAQHEVQVEVRDQGKGMPSRENGGPRASRRTGVGIEGMRERVARLGGHFEIRSDETGTTVFATVPLTAAPVQGATRAGA